jgi:FkbM family methyltransferase
VLREKLEFAVTLREHFDAYIRHHADALRSRPIWGGMLARRHNDPGCIDAMETWFCHVMRYSRRDQLSLPLALAGLPDRTKHLVEAQLHETVMHKWPHSEETKPPYYRVGDDGHESAPKPPPHASKADGVEPIVPASKPAQRPSGAVPPPPGNAPRFAYDPACDLYFVEQGSPHRRIYVSHKQRLALYKKGITHRQNWILGDYRLPHDLVREGDVVVDVGANIGELGLWVADRGGRYVAFEPDPKAFRALRKNVSGDLYDVALSDDNGSTHFYLNTAEADSSLFQPAASDDVVVVRKARLDDFLEEIGRFDRIRLLKVEAEGMEPEVLAGAAETLDVVEYVAVDAGPERGGEDTVPPVMNILTRAGFEVRDCFLTRGTFLLRNTALSPAECARGSTIAPPQAHAAGRALSGEVCAVRRPESASRQ